MRIAIDARSIRHPPTGIGRATARLCAALVELFPNDRFLFLTLPGQVPALWKNWSNVEFDDDTPDFERHPATERWENSELIRRLQRWRCDVLHGPAFRIPHKKAPFARVVTIMDMIAFREPKNYPLPFRLYMQWLTRRSARSADAVIVPSHFVRTEIVRFVPDAQARIHVVTLGPGIITDSAAPSNTVEVETETTHGTRFILSLDQPYFLFVGTLEPRKDVRTVLQAYTIACQRSSRPHRLVIVGGLPRRHAGAAELINRHPYRDRLIWINAPLGDEAMSALYRRARALIFASRCEGFGLPLVEAMMLGVPVIAADAAASREICGKAAVYFTQGDASALAERICELTDQPTLAACLRECGLSRAADFSWTRTARTLYSIYQTLTTARMEDTDVIQDRR